MEEAPKGTFEEELEWCIHQLETGLLRRNPTPRQVTDTQRALRVLRSRKAPFVKKRQVMNQVFGNYRQKMAKERWAQESAGNDPPDSQIQEATAQDAQSVAYRKSLKDVQDGGGYWFIPSSNDFTFNFFPDQNADGSTGAEDHTKEVTCPNPPTIQQDGTLCLDGGLAFTYNFQIAEVCSASESSSAPLATHDASFDHLDPHQMARAVAQELLSYTLDRAASSSGVTAKQTEDKATTESQKKRKKKKKSKTKNVGAQTQNKVEEPRGKVDPVPSLEEEPKSGAADELRREVDWCVEQLELGLQRQKSTPKQVEEALRAIKTLRGEKVPLVKKRQVMRLMFGDYRLKMEEERVKQLRLMQTAPKSAKMTTVTRTARQNSSKFFRKSVRKSSRHAAPKSAPAESQGISDQTAAPSSSTQQGFAFGPSQEAFCFNFF